MCYNNSHTDNFDQQQEWSKLILIKEQSWSPMSLWATEGMNHHWRPLDSLCSFCALNYTWIAKMETFSRWDWCRQRLKCSEETRWMFCSDQAWISGRMGVNFEREAPSLHSHAGQVVIFSSPNSQPDPYLHPGHFHPDPDFHLFSQQPGHQRVNRTVLCSSQPQSEKETCDDLQAWLSHVWLQPLYMIYKRLFT